jgi:hypothetical protein
LVGLIVDSEITGLELTAFFVAQFTTEISKKRRRKIRKNLNIIIFF